MTIHAERMVVLYQDTASMDLLGQLPCRPLITKSVLLEKEGHVNPTQKSGPHSYFMSTSGSFEVTKFPPFLLLLNVEVQVRDALPLCPKPLHPQALDCRVQNGSRGVHIGVLVDVGVSKKSQGSLFRVWGLGAPIRRNIVHWGLSWVPPIYGNYQMILKSCTLKYS